MVRNSIDVVEAWLGQEIDSETSNILSKVPDEQLTDLWSELADSYYGWDDAWLAEAREEPALLHFGGREDHDTGSEGWLNAIKSASLCFDGLIFSDPLAERLQAAVEVGGFLGGASHDTAVRDLTRGIEELVTIRPLVRSGAIRIAPRVFLGLLPDVQELARTQLGQGAGHLEREDGSIDTAPAEFAVLSALCAKLDLEPIAGTQDGLRILQHGTERFAEVLEDETLRFGSGLKSLSIPNVNRVPLEEIVRLRANSEAFDRLRRELRRAKRIAEVSLTANESFEQLFAEELQEVEARLMEEMGNSDVLRDFVVPFGAGLGMGMFALSFGRVDAAAVAGALAMAAVPGVAWIANMLIQALRTNRGGARQIIRLYGHLIS